MSIMMISGLSCVLAARDAGEGVARKVTPRTIVRKERWR